MRRLFSCVSSRDQRFARRIAIAFATTLIGCTFAGIADYDTPECDPTRSLEDDFCNELNTGNTSCQRYQCSASTRRCVLGPVDIDKDGDPAPECGGTDCDDHDPTRSGKLKEICDGIDNDCNGITDDGIAIHAVTPPIANVALSDRKSGDNDLRVASSNGQDTYATYLGDGTACVHGFSLDDPAQADAGCERIQLLDADGGLAAADAAPPTARQPELSLVGVTTQSALAVAFIEANPPTSCTKDQLAYWHPTIGKTVLADCGATLPSLATFPLSPEALVAFYDARIADRVDPIDGCASAKAAPLKLRWVDDPAKTAPDMTTSPASNLGVATATRPPALLGLNGGTSMLLASPLGDSAGLFLLTPDGRIIPLATTMPELGTARSMAMAVGVEDASNTRLAVVAERGCKPAQALTMLIAGFDVVSGALLPTATATDAGTSPFREVDIVDSGIVATAPGVAWVPNVKEWWVTWIDERGKAMLRRVSKDGASIDTPTEIGDALFASVHLASNTAPNGSAGSDGGVHATLPTARLVRPDGSSIDEVRISCSP